MTTNRLYLKSVGMIIDLKRPIENKTALFLSELFDQTNIAASFEFMNAQQHRVNETAVSLIMECAYRLIEKGGRFNHAEATVRMAIFAAGVVSNKAFLYEAFALAGLIYFKSGQFEKALSYIEKAREGFEQLSLPTRVQGMNYAAANCKESIRKRTIRREETCDLCGNEFPCIDGEHIVLSKKPHTLQKAAHCFNCGIVVCFGCAVWRGSEGFVGQEDKIAKDFKTPHCPLCGLRLG